MSPLSRCDAALGRRVSMRALALLRIPVGLIVIMHLRPFVEHARDGFIYRDAFYEPYASWYPELPRSLYVALLYIGVAAAVMMTIGLFTRVACVVTFAVVAYNLFLSTTHMHNNRAYLVVVLAALAVAPCGRELSADAWRNGSPVAALAPAWPLLLLRFEASVVYGASGLSKLLDPNWFGGTVTWDRMVRTRNSMPEWIEPLLTNREFHTYMAKVIVFTELFIAIGLWLRPTRDAAVWVAVVFHVSIELSASVQVFSYLAVSALVIWAVPATRDRVLVIDPDNPTHRRLARTVRWLDWLARFRIEGGTELRVLDRDGSRRSVWFLFSRLPLTAWFALPAARLSRPRVHSAA